MSIFLLPTSYYTVSYTSISMAWSVWERFFFVPMMPFDPKHRRKRSTAPTALQSQKVKQSATVSPQAEVQKTPSSVEYKLEMSQKSRLSFKICVMSFGAFHHVFTSPPCGTPTPSAVTAPGLARTSGVWAERRTGSGRMGQAEHITPKALRGLDGSRLLNNVVMFQGRAAVYLQHFHRTCVRLEVALYSWVGSC